MPRAKNYIFVLWGEGFEEAVAAIFVTGLRRAGLPVKVVGLNFQQISGAHGLGLLPDWTLSEALPHAAQAIGVIIPYLVSDFAMQFSDDPRLREFLNRARSNRAYFISKQADDSTWNDSGLISPNRALFYPADEALLEFVRGVTELLLKPS